MIYRWPLIVAFLLTFSIATPAEAARNGGGPSKFPRCLDGMNDRIELADYVSYLTTHSNVLSAFDPCQYPTQILDAFMVELQEADSTGLPPSAPLPQGYLTRRPGASWVSITREEGDAMVAAKLAHILYVEVRGLVPWLLADYDDTALETLFDVCRQMGCSFGRSSKETSFSFQNLVDHSPRVVWDLLSQSIDQSAMVDPISGMTEIIRYVRGFRHGSRDLDPDLGITTVDEMAAERVARQGCWSMSPYVVALAAALNIPGDLEYGYFRGQHHLSAHFGAVDGVLAHGDDVYNASLSNTPAVELLDSYQRWSREVLRHKPLEGPLSPAGHNSRTHNYEMARLFPSSWTMSRYCGLESGVTGGREFLEIFFDGFATSAELDDLEARMSSTTEGCTLIPRDDSD